MGTSKNSKNSFSLWEKVGMRALKSNIYNPLPSPLPEGEGILEIPNATLPRAERVGKVHLNAGLFSQLGVCRHFLAWVIRYRQAFLGCNTVKAMAKALPHLPSPF
jgi:hypothetical protein